MTRAELRALNTELIEMLIAVRDRIDEKLDELEAVEEGDADDDESGLDEDDED